MDIITFRNKQDYQHYWGSFSISLSLLLLFIFKSPFDFYQSVIYAMMITNVLGLINEIYEQIVPKWDSPWWDTKPSWIGWNIWLFMKENLSGDNWDWYDIYLNFMGSFLLSPILLLFQKRN